MLRDSDCMNCSEQANPQRLKGDSWLPGVGGGGMVVTANGYVVSLWSKGNIPELDNGGGWYHAASVLRATTVCFQVANFWFTCVESEAKPPRHQSLL